MTPNKDSIAKEFVEHSDTILDICQRTLQICAKTQATCSLDDIFDNKEHLAQQLFLSRACFITLNKKKELRGCIGSLRAQEPLLENLIHNTCAAALHDPRFKAVSIQELDDISIHISILTEAVKMNINSEQDLLEQLTKGVDGLILSDGIRSATYLPSVWEQIPDKNIFVQQLKLKAGLAADYWSDTIECKKYQCETIPGN